jgi:hypothetical protein
LVASRQNFCFRKRPSCPKTPGTFGQRAAEPAVLFGALAALVLARTAVIARTYPRPRTQVLLPSTAGGERSSWKGLAVRYYSTN